MKKFILLLFVSLYAATVFAQSPATVLESYKTSKGKYVITYYGDNIIKLTFQPNGYSRGENVSDAVILPPKKIHPALKVRVNGDIVAFNGKTLMVNADSVNGFYEFNFALEDGEMIFGGGERALPLNRRGYRFNLYNNPWYGYGEGADNLNYSVPFFTSSKGYGLFFDNPSKGFADIGKTDENVFKVGFSGGELNVYVIIGNDHQDVLRSYHKLTGTQPLPPRWAFGNLMSRFGYTSEAQVKDLLAKMGAENVPVDAIIFDLFWFGDSIKGTLGNLDWVNKSKWPDPKKMIGDFKKKGINTILVTEPFFVESSKNYAASKKFLAVDVTGKPFYLTDFYFGKGGLIDIFRKDSKDWFWGFYKKQMELGVEAWWGDLGEPEKHPAALYHNLKDLGQKRLFAADEVHNIYGHNWTKMLYQKYATDYPNKRLFSLNRSGFAGSQRYSIFPWTGDVSRSWGGLRAQLPILLGMSMSGVPYVHSDAGGFAGGEGDNELYVRWLQFAAFTPIFRPHGTALYEVEKQAFSFPSEVALIAEPWKEHAKRAIEMRYALLPYNYSLAYQQTKNGSPLIAPLYYHFPKDTTALNIQTEFMWGDQLLVAPVTEKGITEMKIYLPKGKWLGVDSRYYEGEQWITVPVSIEYNPMFLREGALIPGSYYKVDETSIANTARYSKNQFTIVYVPSSSPSAFTWFEDDGLSKNSIVSGKYTLINLKAHDRGSEIYVAANPSNGLYVKKELRFVINSMSTMPKSVVVNANKMFAVIDEAAVPGIDKEGAYWDRHTGVLTVVAKSATGKYEVVVKK